MLVFGHIGITTGIMKMCEKEIKKKKPNLNNFIDYRIVALGAVLPDLIDKPLVQMIYGLAHHEGHLIAHSFIFSLLLMIIGMKSLEIKSNNNILILGICSFIHQTLDRTVLIVNGFPLPTTDYLSVVDRLGFIRYIIMPIYIRFPYFRAATRYFQEPYIFISEVMGFGIVAYYVYKYVRDKKYMEFSWIKEL